MSDSTAPAAAPPDPFQQALVAGAVGGIILGLLQLNPFYLTVVEPILRAAGIDETQLAVKVVSVIQRAQQLTVERGFHVAPIDPNDPGAPRYFVDREGRRV